MRRKIQKFINKLGKGTITDYEEVAGDETLSRGYYVEFDLEVWKNGVKYILHTKDFITHNMEQIQWDLSEHNLKVLIGQFGKSLLVDNLGAEYLRKDTEKGVEYEERCIEDYL